MNTTTRVLLALVVTAVLALCLWGVIHAQRPVAKAKAKAQPPATVTELPEGVSEEEVSRWETIRRPDGQLVKRPWQSVDDQSELLARTSSDGKTPEEIREKRLDSVFNAESLSQEPQGSVEGARNIGVDESAIPPAQKAGNKTKAR